MNEEELCPIVRGPPVHNSREKETGARLVLRGGREDETSCEFAMRE